MKLLSILVLVLSCFVSYGNAKIPKTVEEASQFLQGAEANLAKAAGYLEQLLQANRKEANERRSSGKEPDFRPLTPEEQQELDRSNMRVTRAFQAKVAAKTSVEVRKEHLQAFQTDGSLEKLNKEKDALISKAQEILKQSKGFSLRDIAEETNEDLDFVIEDVEKVIEELEELIQEGQWNTKSHIQEMVDMIEKDIRHLLGNTEARGLGPCQYCGDSVSPLHASSAGRDDQTAVSNVPSSPSTKASSGAGAGEGIR